MDPSSALRRIPSVEKVLVACAADTAIQLPRALMVRVVRQALDEIRERFQSGVTGESEKDPLQEIRAELTRLSGNRLKRVINATGVLLHTNLGRSPMSAQSVAKAAELAGNYCNAELDLSTGRRGGRAELLEVGLAAVCGAQAATVVNNCAGALVLILRALVEDGRREVLVSRGELVEIGGGFRIPEIMETSGAVLIEVGTTNRTRLSDYRDRIGPETAMLLKVHRSNFQMEGFVAEPDLSELAALGHEFGLPVIGDLGSGALIDPSRWHGLDHEPSPAEWLQHGLDLVCISGDKLMGGPQAGVIAGGAEWIRRVKRDPFFRALRCDKMVLGALQETVLMTLEGSAVATRVHELLGVEIGELEQRADRIRTAIQAPGVSIEVRPCVGKIGGGTMPQARVPSVALKVVTVDNGGVEALSHRLRSGKVPVVGYVDDGALWLDLRTVMEDQDLDLLQNLHNALDGVISAAG